MPPFKEWLALSQSYHDVAAVIGWAEAIDLGSAVCERKRPPSRLRGCGSSGGEGGFIYIPTSFRERSGRDLASLVGHGNARKLIARFGGAHLFFPSIERASRARRDKAIVEQVRNGSRVAVVACAFNLTERQVRRIVTKESSRHALQAA